MSFGCSQLRLRDVVQGHTELINVAEAELDHGQSDSLVGCFLNFQAAFLIRFIGSETSVPRPRDPSMR